LIHWGPRDFYKLNTSFGAVAPTPKPQSGRFVNKVQTMKFYKFSSVGKWFLQIDPQGEGKPRLMTNGVCLKAYDVFQFQSTQNRTYVKS
jgi:hypothetical protein